MSAEQVVLALRVREAALEIVRLGERDRVHEQVEPAEPLRHRREGAVEALVVPDVALDAQVAAEARGELAHVRLDARTLVGEREGRALGCQRLRHGPRDRPSIRHAGDERQLPVEESRHGVPPYRITIGRPLPVLHCGPVGATRLLSAIACAMALAFVPAASGATGDLTVTVSTLNVQSTIQRGKPVTLRRDLHRARPAHAARARHRRARADRTAGQRTRYTVASRPATVRPAIWKWSVTDTLPPALAAGTYKVVATITLVRGKTRVAHGAGRSRAVIVG